MINKLIFDISLIINLSSIARSKNQISDNLDGLQGLIEDLRKHVYRKIGRQFKTYCKCNIHALNPLEMKL